MMKQALALFPLPMLMVLALGLFLLAFLLITARALSRGQSVHQERLARLPLSED